MTTTPTKEYFTSKQLADRWQVPEDKLKEVFPPETIDGSPCYSYNMIIEYENYLFFTQEELAERWDVPLDEIIKLDKIISPITFDGRVHYRITDILMYLIHFKADFLIKRLKERNLP